MKIFFPGEMKLGKKAVALLLAALMIMLSVPFSAGAEELASAALVAANGTESGMVRVYLASIASKTTLNLTIQGSYTVNGQSTMAVDSGSVLTVNLNAATGQLSLSKNGQNYSMGSQFKLRRHQTSGTNGVKIAQSREPFNVYPGDIHFVAKANGSSYQLYTIVYVYMEDYLYGVVPYEMGSGSPLEALKAQAVSARTYTLRAMKAASAGALYHVKDTTADQVYNGTPSGKADCKAAVDATKGIVAKNGADFTGMWYTASNGGQIEAVKNIWGSTAYPYIRVKEDPYDYQNPDSPVRSFTVNSGANQSNSKFGSLLNAKAAAVFGYGAAVTGVSGITPHTPKYLEPSRLYTMLDFDVQYMINGVSKAGRLTFSIFDELEGPLSMSIQTMKNELWSVQRTAEGFRVEARRYGHGTGMSQRGAMQMGRMGYTYDQIIAFYFEGCTRVQYTLSNTIMSPVINGSDSFEVTTDEEAADLPNDTACRALVTLPGSGEQMALRMQADGNSAVLYKVQNGAEVTVLGKKGDWCLVQFGAIRGYALRSALTISGTIPALTDETATAITGFGTVTAGLNLRKDPSTSSAALITIPQGAALPLIDVSNGWAYTQYGRLVGYVSMDYIMSSNVYPEAVYDADQVSATLTVDTPFYMTKNTNGYVLGSLNAGTEVALISDDGAWAAIRFNKVTAYVKSDAVNRTYHATGQSEDDMPTGGEYYVKTQNSSALNFRTSGDTNATVMAELPLGTRLIVESKGSTWSRVRYRGVVGYVMNSYLTDDSPTDDDLIDTGIYATVSTESGSLNLRQGADVDTKKLTAIPRGTRIMIIERGTEWSKTAYGGHIGYVMNSFLTFENIDQPTEPPITVDPNGPLMAKVQTSGGSLSLRENPLSNSKAIAKIANGTVLAVKEKGTNWYLVEYHDMLGYVQAKYMTILGGNPELAKPTTVSDEESIKNDQLDNSTIVGDGTIGGNNQETVNDEQAIEAPAAEPIVEATAEPTTEPIVEATAEPTTEPIIEATIEPTTEPINEAMAEPTTEPIIEATAEPTTEPIIEATAEPTTEPIVEEIAKPTTEPIVEAIVNPTTEPIVEAIAKPTTEPIVEAIVNPTTEPIVEAMVNPTTEPIVEAMVNPTTEPIVEEIAKPTTEPIVEAIVNPTTEPIVEAMANPTAQPIVEATAEPTTDTIAEATAEPIIEPAAPPEETFDLETENAKRDLTLAALPEPIEVKVNIASGRLNLRKGCSTKSEIIEKIDAADPVRLLSRGETWCLIEYKEEQGYVLAKYLELPNE